MADRPPLAGVVVGGLGVTGCGERVGDGVVGVDAQRAEQLVVAGEVAVQGRGGGAHLPGDRAQRQRAGPLLGELLARQGLDLLNGGLPLPVAARQWRCGGGRGCAHAAESATKTRAWQTKRATLLTRAPSALQ